MSLSQAAAAIPAARSGIAAYEAGDTVPGGDLLGRMAAAYGVEVGFFFVHDRERDSASTGRGKPTDGAAAGRRSPVGAHREG